MGYYTRHKLEIIEGNDNFTDYEKEISDSAGYSLCFEEEIKWYDHEDVMRIYSLKHPGTVFKLIGEGEENGDIWHEYYKNGLMQRCKAEIIIEPFNENLLR